MRIKEWKHQFVVVRKYQKPEIVRGIVTSPAWRVDNSRSLWELKEVTPEALGVLGYEEMHEGWILVTAPNSGVYVQDVWTTNEDGRPEREEEYILLADMILRVIPWTHGEKMPRMKGNRLLVNPRCPRRPSPRCVSPGAKCGSFPRERADCPGSSAGVRSQDPPG